jgi:hypothetical protein
MDVILEKQNIINQIQSLEDEDLILAVKSLLDCGHKQSQVKFEIPAWQQLLVLHRKQKLSNNPETAITWEAMMQELDIEDEVL